MNYAIKLVEGTPKEFILIEGNTVPDGYDVVWSETQWNNYVESVISVIILTPETATQVIDFYDMVIDNYNTFRTALLAIVEGLGEGDEIVGFNTLDATEREFVALNGIGSKAQIDSVLSEPTKQTIDFLTSKQVI
jgi:hypothetical protein